MSEPLYTMWDDEKAQQLLNHLPQQFLIERRVILDRAVAAFHSTAAKYPHVVTLNNDYLDEWVGGITRMRLIEDWLHGTFPSNSFMAFTGEGLGPYKHYAHSVAFTRAADAVRFRLTW